MALKGLDIFKMSPKKNCKECGSPTCMAFCMKVAQGAVEIDKCPYFSEEAKASLNEATAPAMKTISVGEHKLGGETVLFRHEKTLVNKNLFAVCVCTDCADKADEKLANLQKIDYERIGERMYVEFIHVAVDCRNNIGAAFHIEGLAPVCGTAYLPILFFIFGKDCAALTADAHVFAEHHRECTAGTESTALAAVDDRHMRLGAIFHHRQIIFFS